MEVKIRITGAAGQGVQTTADLLGKAATRCGLFVTSYADAESRIRGGINFCHLRLSTEPKMGVTDEFDILVTLSETAAQKYAPQLRGSAVLVSHEPYEHSRCLPYSLNALAKQAGSVKANGTVAIAAIAQLVGIQRDVLEKTIGEQFSAKPELAKINILAAKLGYEAAKDTDSDGRFHLDAKPGPERLWIAGHNGISLGAIAGGVSFVAGYPMSPATSILTDLAAWSEEAGVMVEQAEDEIGAINMVAGASYAGARSMTATSGGGFCLMTEGISLLGMIETPAVIVIAQRPGPATGLPTRTAQGDLHLVLHAGHGYFPRIILAPHNVSEGFQLTARAFDMAERFQVPVFILTDQLLQDNQTTVEPFEVDGLPTRRHVLEETELNGMKLYQRYAQTPSGVSPLALPGASHHVVIVDSDEHDEDGHLTEDAEIAERMAKKRQTRAQTISSSELLPPPQVQGDIEDKPLIMSWGSTYETVAEARSILAEKGDEFAHLHLTQMWPLPKKIIIDCLEKASHFFIVENNVGGELATLLRTELQRKPDQVINRLDGRPFHVTELVGKLGEVLP